MTFPCFYLKKPKCQLPYCHGKGKVAGTSAAKREGCYPCGVQWWTEADPRTWAPYILKLKLIAISF